MSAAFVAVGVSLVVVILMITAVLMLLRRKRVRRQRDETPEGRYRREVLNIRHGTHVRTQPRAWRRRRNRAADSTMASGPTSYDAVGGVWAAGSGGGGGGGGD